MENSDAIIDHNLEGSTMSANFSLETLSGEQLLTMCILGVIDQKTADAELDRRAMETAPTMEETLALLNPTTTHNTSKAA